MVSLTRTSTYKNEKKIGKINLTLQPYIVATRAVRRRDREDKIQNFPNFPNFIILCITGDWIIVRQNEDFQNLTYNLLCTHHYSIYF